MTLKNNEHKVWVHTESNTKQDANTVHVIYMVTTLQNVGAIGVNNQLFIRQKFAQKNNARIANDSGKHGCRSTKSQPWLRLLLYARTCASV